MRLIEKNIEFVREMTKDDITYYYFVKMKSNNSSDNKQFINYNKNGVTTDDYYAKERLPKSVQNFINKREPILERSDIVYATYIYK